MTIMKATKKPVTIEYLRLIKTNVREVYEFIHGEIKLESEMDRNKWEEFRDITHRHGLHFKTLESNGETQVADIGDYIIKGVKGEFYPCKPDIFMLTYDIN